MFSKYLSNSNSVDQYEFQDCRFKSFRARSKYYFKVRETLSQSDLSLKNFEALIFPITDCNLSSDMMMIYLLKVVFMSVYTFYAY